jgi:signal transduction histidine kinase
VAAAGSAVCKRVIETGEEDVDREMSGPSAAYPNQRRDWLVSHHPVKDNGIVIGVNVILQDITERKKAEAEIEKNQIALQASLDRIRDLAGRLIEVQEVERTRIARELHDDVNQRVAVLSISLSNMRRKLPASAIELREAVTKVQNEARQLAEELRNLSHELHPGILRQLGLIPALSIYREEFQQNTGIETELDTSSISSPIPQISTELSLCLYRVAQEALRNAARHSCAKKIRITIGREVGNLFLCIKDDGCGFNVEKARTAGGLGLLSIDERIRLVRGSVTIYSRPQFGTRLFIQIPLKGNDHVPTETAPGR